MLRALRRLRPTDAWTRALFAPVLMFVATSVDRNYQTDLWHHLARGRAIAASGALVDHDLFSYTVPPEQSFQDASWLAQLSYYYLYTAGGLPLVQLANTLVLTAMIAGVVWLCRRRSGSMVVAAGLAGFTFLGLWQLLLIRPQTYSMFLFVALYGVLELARTRRAWLALAPPIFALWANLHGGFPVGLALVGCYVVAAGWDAARAAGWSWWRDGQLRALGLCIAACAAATLVNPYGWRVYQYVAHTSGIAAARRIDEWVPPGLDLLVSKVWVVSVLGIIVLFALPGPRPAAREVCLVLCFLPPACGSVRMAAWWLLVVAPVAAARFAAVLPPRLLAKEENDRPTLGAAIAFPLLVAVCVLSLPWLERWNPVQTALHRTGRPEDKLQAAADRLRQCRAGGRVFSRFEWGEYFGWALAPDFKIFMDGRIEIYSDRVWNDYSAITRGRADWQEVLDGYAVDCLMLDRDGGYHADLLPLVERSPCWERAFESGPVVVFLRRRFIVSRNDKSSTHFFPRCLTKNAAVRFDESSTFFRRVKPCPSSS
ncbi:MAG TPA: hypothetical protein VFW33_13580 [Gemmataceae bacterium]|nr:hypothetical protein [Gemmataceae bacterium]